MIYHIIYVILLIYIMTTIHLPQIKSILVPIVDLD